ncbi:hypothetical protein AC579_3367 [Pseudocercospora musae]|uniref:Uncharacterized protein n=1 Tax=Pseudocercospora musae TaxID=113226 RepID=A0A139GTJ2_9PEZI|nr:hypothetical protein AC579_3367 [Pseudocercospora musae]
MVLATDLFLLLLKRQCERSVTSTREADFKTAPMRFAPGHVQPVHSDDATIHNMQGAWAYIVSSTHGLRFRIGYLINHNAFRKQVLANSTSDRKTHWTDVEAHGRSESRLLGCLIIFTGSTSPRVDRDNLQQKLDHERVRINHPTGSCRSFAESLTIKSTGVIINSSASTIIPAPAPSRNSLPGTLSASLATASIPDLIQGRLAETIRCQHHPPEALSKAPENAIPDNVIHLDIVTRCCRTKMTLNMHRSRVKQSDPMGPQMWVELGLSSLVLGPRYDRDANNSDLPGLVSSRHILIRYLEELVDDALVKITKLASFLIMVDVVDWHLVDLPSDVEHLTLLGALEGDGADVVFIAGAWIAALHSRISHRPGQLATLNLE